MKIILIKKLTFHETCSIWSAELGVDLYDKQQQYWLFNFAKICKWQEIIEPLREAIVLRKIKQLQSG